MLPMLNAAGEVVDKFEIISNLSISVRFKEKISQQKLSRTSQNSTQSEGAIIMPPSSIFSSIFQRGKLANLVCFNIRFS